MRVRFLGWEDPLEKGMATHCSILAWRIPWTEEPGGLQSTRSQRVGHNAFRPRIMILLGLPRGSRSPPPPATTRALPTGVSPGVNRGPWTSAGSNEAAQLPCDVQTNRLNQQAQRGPRRTTERATVHISTENHSSSPKPGRSQMGEGQPVAGNAQGTGMSVLNLSLKWQNQKCLDT